MASLLGPIGLAMSVASTIAGGLAAQSQSKAAAQEQRYVAAEEQQAAGQARATSQQKAIQDNDQAKLLEGRAEAVAGASGVEGTSPSVVTGVGNIARRGSYNALSDLYTGEERARGYEAGANLADWQAGQDIAAGNQKRYASLFSTVGTIAGSETTKTLLQNYGGSGPPPLTNTATDYVLGDIGGYQ